MVGLGVLISVGLFASAVVVDGSPSAQVPPPLEGPVLAIDLDSAYKIALERNLDVRVARASLAEQDARLWGSGGIFDTTLNASVNGSYSETPTASQLSGADVYTARSLRFSLGLEKLLPSGTRLGAAVSATRSETNSVFYFLNPSWQTDFTLTVSQPLLKGFGTVATRTGIMVAANSRRESAEDLKMAVRDVVSGVEMAYWDLVAAREAVKVKEESLKLAERLLEETQKRVEVGTAAPIELVQCEAAIAARKQELIAARNRAADAEDKLKAAMGFGELEEWDIKLEPTEGLEIEPISPDLEQAVEWAVSNRPEVRKLKIALDNARLNWRLARNSVLPQLDLTASYGFAGVGGDRQVVDMTTGQVLSVEPGGFDEAARQLRDMDFPHWTLGLSLSMPLGNEQAKSEVAAARWSMEQARLGIESLKQQLVLQVRQAVRSLEDGAASIEAATAARKAAEKNLEAENTKLRNGLSTNFQVLEVQEDLSNARMTELEAKVAYRKALVSYWLAVGKYLERRGIHVKVPQSPSVPHDRWGEVRWLDFVDMSSSLGGE